MERTMEKPAEQALWRCPSCDHRQVFPIPDAETVASYYRYSNDGENVSNAHLAQLWNGGLGETPPTYLRRLQWAIKRKGKGARLLDIGYGSGSLLRSAHELGCHVTGIDPDDRHFEPDFPCDLRTCALSDGVFAPQSFDIICAHHVLEHVRDVRGTVSVIQSLLKDGGIIIIELPHEIRSLIKRVKRTLRLERYSYFTRYQHLRFFSVESLRCLLDSVGLSVVRCRSIHGYEYLRPPFNALLWPLAPVEALLGAGHFLEATCVRRCEDS